MFEGGLVSSRKNQVIADVLVPEWTLLRDCDYVSYLVPYLELGHSLSIIRKSDANWFILSRCDSDLPQRISEAVNWSSLSKHPDYYDSTIVQVRKDGSWCAVADRFGIYPLYYWREENEAKKRTRIWFDLKQAGTARPWPSRRYCALFLAGLNQTYPFDSFTVWEGVRQLSPGCKLESSIGGAIDCKRVAPYPACNDSLACVVPRFEESVSLRLNEVLGGAQTASCDLSGGFDSSYTAATVAQYVQNLQTVFLDDGEGNRNDKLWAEKIAYALRSEHKNVGYLEHSSVLGLETSSIRSCMAFGFDESFRYVALAPYLARTGIEFGAAVHLNGHGGDELFGANAAMAWSYLRSGRGSRVQRIKNAIGFAKANKFGLSDFRRSLANEQSFVDNLADLGSGKIENDTRTEKHDSNWIPAPEIPSFCTQDLRYELSEVSRLLAEESMEPYSEDRSQHRIAEDVIAHAALLRSMNSFETVASSLRFASLFLSPRVIMDAMSLSIADRFLARTAKPLLFHTWPSEVPKAIFKRQDKGEYSPATFVEFGMVKRRIKELLSENSLLNQMNLVDAKLVEQSLSAFSVDGTSLDSLMRAASLESWLSEK